ncbi:MAG: type II toxin-antitoxin system VapC family toxin [Pseudomonadota bacterium]
MLIVDTSVFVDFLRRGDETVSRALESGLVLSHPFVTGEIALGHLKNRSEIISLLTALPRAVVASDDEILSFIERFELHGRGIGYVDTHLLASARLSGAALWTRDRKLLTIATDLQLASAGT